MHTIYIAGLGPGNIEQIPVGVLETLETFEGPFYIRTEDHPAVGELKDRGLTFKSYDSVYEAFNEDFDQVYPAITEDLIEKSKETELLYAVPGHPMVAEKTVKLLLESSEAQVKILGGKSFIDDMFQAVEEDPIEGFQLLDALDFKWSTVAADQHVIFMQVFHPFIASQLKLDLERIYPKNHQVALVDQAGTPEEKVRWKKLEEMDDFEGVRNLLSVYVPPLAASNLQATFPYLQALVSEKIEAGEDLEGLEKFSFSDNLDLEKEELLADMLWRILVTLKNGEELGYFEQRDIINKIIEKQKEEQDETR